MRFVKLPAGEFGILEWYPGEHAKRTRGVKDDEEVAPRNKAKPAKALSKKPIKLKAMRSATKETKSAPKETRPALKVAKSAPKEKPSADVEMPD
jgi:hypothetical protein